MYQSHAIIYGSSKPSNWSPTGAWLIPTALLIGSEEKLGTDRGSISRRAVDCVGSPFSR
jgi:hypothetical protein